MGRVASTIVQARDRVFSGASFAQVFFNLVDCTRVTFLACQFYDCVIRIQGSQQIHILDCMFDQCRGSHFVQCDPDTDRVVGLVIAGCTFKGNGLPFYRDSVGGTPIENGACGDALSIRNCQDFHIAGNQIVGGGEIGITCLHGSVNGTIVDNTITNNDAVPIQIGGRDQRPVRNVVIARNLISASGMNRAGGVVAWPGVWVWNASDVAVVHNRVESPGPSLRYGVVAQQCQRLTLARNIFPFEKPLRIPRVHERSVTDLITDVQSSY